mgnify:FL=1
MRSLLDVETAGSLDGALLPGGFRLRAGVIRRGGDVGNPVGTSFWPAGTHARREVELVRRVAAHQLGIHPRDFRLLRQVHGTRVVRRSAEEGPEILEADAQVTTETGLALIVNVADCCPVVVFSRNPPVAGIAHSGWRGTAAGVVPELVQAILEHGATVADLRAWVGPCAGGNVYEVGREVARHFQRWPAALQEHPQTDEKQFLDVGRAVQEQLIALGLPVRSIERSFGDTIGDRRYHSHRRSLFAAGRMAGFVAMVPGGWTRATTSSYLETDQEKEN